MIGESISEANSVSQEELEMNKKTEKMEEEYFVSLRLKIIDNGVGISEEGKSKLFIDFNKLDENCDRNQSGTGLGLSICK